MQTKLSKINNNKINIHIYIYYYSIAYKAFRKNNMTQMHMQLEYKLIEFTVI